MRNQRHRLKIYTALSFTAALLSGCIDNGYDLSNIDTTSQIPVSNLILPINFENVELKQVFNLEENSNVKIMEIDGKKFYYINAKGDFRSKPIEIPSFGTSAPASTASVAQFSHKRDSEIGGRDAYSFRNFQTQYIPLDIKNIDPAIVSIESADLADMSIDITFSAEGLSEISDIEMNDVSLRILKGLILKNVSSNINYEYYTGTLRVSQLKFDASHRATVHLDVAAIDFSTAKIDLDPYSQSLPLKWELSMTGGSLTCANPGSATLPSDLELKVESNISAITASDFTGSLHYPLGNDGLDIPDVDLSNFPYFLTHSGTDLKLENPQLYLSMTNPLWESNVVIQTSPELTAIRNGNVTETFYPDTQAILTIGSGLGDKPFNFVFSPKEPTTTVPEAYKNLLRHVSFPSMRNLFSGTLPSAIGIRLADAQIPQQSVNKFILGKKTAGIEGSYELLAPLTLVTGENGGVISYSTFRTGWAADTRNMTIQSLEIEAQVTNSIPLGGTIIAIPIDKDGNRIDAVLECTDFKANTFQQKITVKTTGLIENLDGVIFEAVVRPGSISEPLGPDQTVVMQNVKVKVSGYYSKEL